MILLLFLGIFVLAFLLGSIPWGVIISKVFYHKDIRSVGSGNIGTTNAMRAMGKVGGCAVFVLDFGKGVLAGFLGALLATQTLNADVAGCASVLSATSFGLVSYEGSAVNAAFVSLATSVAFLGCILGHVFSPWLKFKGGKGIAVAAGCLLAVFGLPGFLIEIAAFAILVFATRYVSAGSLAAAVICPVVALFCCDGNPLAWLCCLAGAVVVIWAHRGNISRLRQGCERRIGESKSADSEEVKA